MDEILTPQQKIEIFKNLFRGREDVFAVRWEKGDKSASGYTPVCLNEWKRGLCNKLSRKKCRECEHKQYARLDDYRLEQHLRGNKVYGIYPLLEDNSSYFLAADFDGEKWKEDASAFLNACKKHKLFAYLERSRSGNGGHVWIFFEERYPAGRSRNVAVHILREAKIIDQFDKEDSFDRLFPNQDLLSREGFGNLIALPLQGEARKSGSTVFLDWKNGLGPFPDQWDFLGKVQKTSAEKLDKLFELFNQAEKLPKIKNKKGLVIMIREQIYLNKNNLSRTLTNFLREKLNFSNLDYVIKKRMGMDIHKTERYFKLIEDKGDQIAIPRGFLKKLKNFLSDQGIDFEIVDERKRLRKIKFESG